MTVSSSPESVAAIAIGSESTPLTVTVTVAVSEFPSGSETV